MGSLLDLIRQITDNIDGEVEEVVAGLPDDSDFAVVSLLPLPDDHWLTKDPESFNVPPMPLRIGNGNPLRKPLVDALRSAGQYAVRCATNNGKDGGFDPDTLIQCLITGMLGYYTSTGLSEDE